MILNALFCSLYLAPFQDPLERGRVSAFARAATGRTGEIDVATLGKAPPSRNLAMEWSGRRAYSVGGATIWVDAASGLIVGFAGGGDHSVDRPSRPRTDARGRPGLYPAPRRVSDEEARALARRFFAATGREYPIDITRIDDRSGGNDDCLMLHYAPMFHGIRHGGPFGYLEIDRETGELASLLVGAEPLPPPASVDPKVAAEAAHLSALRAAAGAFGVAVRDLDRLSVGLRIEALRSYPIASAVSLTAFTPKDRADLAARRTRLVYDVKLCDARLGCDQNGVPYVVLAVIVDATDGRVLEVVRDETASFGVGGPSGATYEPPFASRPWRVGLGKGPWSGSVVATLTPVSTTVPVKGERMFLTDGRVAIPGLYDAKANLVGIEGRAYRPGPDLANLMRRKIKG